MTKSLPLLILSLAMSLLANAQPVLGPSYEPRLPASMVRRYAEEDTIRLTGGANQAWNFTLTSSGEDSLRILSYVPDPSLPFLTDANFEVREVFGPSTEAEYMRVDGRGIYRIGQRNDGAVAEVPGMPIIPYALGFGQSLTVVNRVVDTLSNPQQFYQRDLDTITYDGYGSLTLNGQTYTPAVLLVTRANSQSATQPGGPWTSFRLQTIRSIWVEGMGEPIVKQISSNGPFGGLSVTYLSDIRLSTRQRVAAAWALAYPQPATGHADLRLPDGRPASGTAVLTDALGRIIGQVLIENGRISLSGLGSGLYQARFMQGDQAYRARLSVR